MKERTLDGPLLPLVARLNEIRRAEPALQRIENLRWLETENDQLSPIAKDDVIVVVNVDPFAEREGVCTVPVTLGFPPVFARPRAPHRDWRSRGAPAATTSGSRPVERTS